MQVYARLTGGHKAAITELQVLGSKEENGHDLLLSAAADGSVAVWEPSSAAPQGPDKERTPKVAFLSIERDCPDCGTSVPQEMQYLDFRRMGACSLILAVPGGPDVEQI